MRIRIEPNAEPIPGYRLIERLGSGGFGEVWKAVAPGGIFKAIKFVYGEIAEASKPVVDESSVIGSDADGVRAQQEFKSLERVKQVRHPYLLSLERYDVISGQLVIVMELAERTLWDRFKECRASELPGIPREELLDFLEETAEVLDIMYNEHQLQHLDIKPQNLFVVSRHVKVADFGLVKDLANQPNAMVTMTGGVTPVYAAPESFLDEKISRQSDQYSLAIVYQELLTGQRPIAGATMNQLYLHHLQGLPPDVSSLPVGDRPIVVKALARRWEDRHPSCTEFIRLLRKATRHDQPALEPTKGTLTTQDTAGQRTAAARGNVAGPVKPVSPNFSPEEAFFGHRPRMTPPAAPPLSPSPSTAPPDTPGALAPSTSVPVPGPRRSKAGDSTQELPGLLQPALVVGLGQLGIDTLLQLRHRLNEEFGLPEDVPVIRLLAIDTDPDTIQRASTDPARAPLQGHEVVLAKLQRANAYIKSRDGKLPTDSWLNPKLLYRIPRDHNQAGLRPLGRLALVDNYRPISRRLESELLACSSKEALQNAQANARLGLRSLTPRIYVVASLTGNTGGGMFLDVAYLLRKLLRTQGHEDAEIVGLFYVPMVRNENAASQAVQNAHAALMELRHFSSERVVFESAYETAASSSKESMRETGPAFDRCILLPLPEVKGKVTPSDNLPTVTLAGDFLCRDLTTFLGPAIDEQRRTLRGLSDPGLTIGPIVQTLGMFRLYWPRHALLAQCARRLCRRLVAHWMSKDARPVVAALKPWTHERWESLGMRSEDLIERFQTMAEHALQQKPESMLAEILATIQGPLLGDSKQPRSVDLGVIAPAMSRFETVLGHPDEIRAASGSIEPSILERAFADIAHVVADECEQKLAEWAVTLLEDPHYRLVGAEEALRQFFAAVEHALAAQETLAKELADRAKQLHERIGQLARGSAPAAPATPTTTPSLWGMGRKSAPNHAGPSGADLFELVRTYAKTRYHSLVLLYLNRLYLGLRGHLSDQIREVGFCRQRLGELHTLLAPPELSRTRSSPLAGERVLYPTGCLDLSDAIERVSQEVADSDLLAFDQRVQAWIVKHCRALLEVCMGASTTVRSLAPAMIREAEAFLNVRLAGNSVAEMYVTRKRAEQESLDEDAIADDLQRCHDEAVSDLGGFSHAREFSNVSLPNDEAGQQLQQILKKAFPELKILMTDRQDEIVFYRELINLQWKNLEQLGPIAQASYHKRLAADPSSLHSREDITEWK